MGTNRDILTKRIANGWSNSRGDVRALRDTELQKSLATTSTRKTFWTVEALDPEGNVRDWESVNTLDEADDIASMFADRDWDEWEEDA